MDGRVAQYNMILQHRKGKNHCNADSLSRVQTDEYCKCFSAGVRVENLPCGGSTFGIKAHNQRSSFIQEVDDAEGLVCRSVRELDDSYFDAKPDEAAMEGPPAVVEISPTTQGVTVIKGERREPVIREVRTEGPSCIWGLSVEEIVKAQSQDGNLEIVSKWSTEANCPSEGALFLASPDAKYFWINKDRVRMIGVLYLQKKTGEDLDLILPERLKKRLSG